MNDRVVKNPNFKNNGEFNRSLKARGVGAKGFPNTHTEVEYLGGRKFAASISVGHRVFFDKADGNKPKKHKLTDERSNGKDYVLVQGAKCCVEVYPYYAKYFDVQHEEVRLYEERWVVQRLFKEPDTWRDVDAYNPIMSVEEYSEPAGDVIKVTVAYDTDYGPLTIQYFQRDGNALKHNVTFKNMSGSTETFRVLQREAGIVADKVDGEEITAPTERFKYGFRFEKAGKLQLGENLNSLIPTWQDEAEAAKKMWARHGECNRCGKCCLGCPHYTEEYPRCKIYDARPDLCKEFPWSPEQVKHIAECPYSFEATGVVISPTKLHPTVLDIHPQGLKADFVYGNWPLVQDESLTLDPDSATLDNPTEDGDIKKKDTTYTRDIGGAVNFRYSQWNSWEHWRRGYVEWDISGIEDGATITKVEFRYHAGPVRLDASYIYEMSSQPSAQSDDNAGNQVIFDDAGGGTAFLSNSNIFIEPGESKDVGGASGPAWDTAPIADLQSQLASDWFAFGFYNPTNGGKTLFNYIWAEDHVGANPKPTLYVEGTDFEPPAVGLENKSANMGAKMVGAGLI